MSHTPVTHTSGRCVKDRLNSTWLLPVAFLIPFFLHSTSRGQEQASTHPWWDNLAVFVGTTDPAQAQRVNANAVLSGSGDDPTWGTFPQRERIVQKQKATDLFHKQGMKILSYVEGFGETICYVAEIRQAQGGGWQKDGDDPTRTRLFLTAYNWQRYDGAGSVHWIGVSDYFQDSDVIAPWTRTNPRYGCGVITYPNGQPALGQTDPQDPRTCRMYDAGSSKDVNGHVTFNYQYFPGASMAGLLKTAGATGDVPDPGFTPEQWAKMKDARYSGAFSAGKDIACPIWVDYERASVRQQLDAGIDGLWIDNYSPWDNFGPQPIDKAFGEWSVAGFPKYLDTHFTLQQLEEFGVPDAARFDIRTYLRTVCRKFGGNPDDTKDPKWSDPRWSDDPLWRAYLIYKRQAGTSRLSAFYHAIKEEAAAEGKPDFLIAGNDIPGFSLGWPRGDLDMVSTELASDWALTAGPRGLMFPPFGSYVPVYQLAREHAKSRYVNAWLYVPKEDEQKPGLASVLYAQGLAFDAVAMPHYEATRTAGTEESDAQFFAFVNRIASVFKDRTQLNEVGLYYSSSSQLMEMVPGGFRHHGDQPHSFSFYGWGTALTFLHVPWRAIPEWKLDLLQSLRVLIIPSADIFAAEDVPVVEKWVEGGGSLVIVGSCGSRQGELGNFERCQGNSTLQEIIPDHPSAGGDQLGKGRVLVLPTDPGLEFYSASSNRPQKLPVFASILQSALRDEPPLLFDAGGVDWKTNLNLHHDANAFYIDIANTDLEPATDKITPTATTTVRFQLPAGWNENNLSVDTLSPGEKPQVKVHFAATSVIELTVGPTELYTCVVLRKK